MYYHDKAIVLSRRVFKENDLLLSCYTEKHGKILCQVRGAKKIKAKLASHLEPLNLVELYLVRGRKFWQLIGAQKEYNFPQIKKDLIKIAYGCYLVEIIDQLVKVESRDTRIFKLLKNFLEKIFYIDPVRKMSCSLPRLDRNIDNSAGWTSCARVSNGVDKKHLPLIRVSFILKLLTLLGYDPTRRKEISFPTKNLFKKIVYSPTSDILKIKFSSKELRDIFKNSEEFLKEYLDQPLKTERFLRYVISTQGY